MILYQADEASIGQLMLAEGSEVEEIKISDLNIGDIIRVHTASGNRYLLEISDPDNNKAHIYRYKGRDMGMKGYRGERFIFPLRLRRNMIYTKSANPEDKNDIRKIHQTSPVEAIYILPY